MQIRDPGEAGLCIRRRRLGCDQHVQQCRAILEGALDGSRQVFRTLDAFCVQAERPGHCRMVSKLQARADDLSVSLLLVPHFDGPGPVVRNHDEHRHLVARSGVDFHGVEAECAITGEHCDGAVRTGETGRNAKRRSDPDATQGARIEIRRSRQADTRKAEKVSTVGDDHCVLRQLVTQRGKQAVRMHQPVAARLGGAHRLNELVRTLLMLLAHRGGPVGIGCRNAIAGELQHGLDRTRRRGEQLGRATPVVTQLGRAICDAQEARVPKNRRRAECQLEIEAAPDGDHHIGFAHDGAASRCDHRGVRVRHQTAAFTGIQVKRAHLVEQPHEGRCCAACAAPGDDEGSAG